MTRNADQEFDTPLFSSRGDGSIRYDVRCGNPVGKPRCAKYMPPAKGKPEGVCGLRAGHNGYCVRGATAVAHNLAPKPDTCGLCVGHEGTCAGSRSIESKKAHKRETYVPVATRKPTGSNSFSRGDLDRLKVWIGCQIPGGCPLALSGHPDNTIERKPEWFDWDRTDPALSGSLRMSFELVTEIFETEALRVLCKCCHATITKNAQQTLLTEAEYGMAREKPDAIVYDTRWNEHPDWKPKPAESLFTRGTGSRPGWGSNTGPRF